MNIEDMTRDELLSLARSIACSRNLSRYGIDAVDENWLNSRSDEQLRMIIEADQAKFFDGPQFMY